MENGRFDIVYLFGAFLVIWLAVLSFYYYQSVAKFKRLTKGATGRDLEQIVERLIERQDLGMKSISQISQELVNLQKRSAVFFQKSSLIRFNPFEDAGGDQSFVITLLDGNDTGFIISSLHSRSGTRVYAKEIKNGKSTTHSLTKEEKEALDKTLRRK